MKVFLSCLVAMLSLGMVWGQINVELPTTLVIQLDNPNGGFSTTYPTFPNSSCMPIYWVETDPNDQFRWRPRTDMERYAQCDTANCAIANGTGSCNPAPMSSELACSSSNPFSPCQSCRCKNRTVYWIDNTNPENSYTYSECGCCNSDGCNVVYQYAPGDGGGVILLDDLSPLFPTVQP